MDKFLKSRVGRMRSITHKLKYITEDASQQEKKRTCIVQQVQNG